MKIFTFYIYVKKAEHDDFVHVTATLNNTAPKGFIPQSIQNADTKWNAITKAIPEFKICKPDKSSEFNQSKFI
jgi:hypothetical protein